MKVSDDREYALDLAVLEVDEIHDIFFTKVSQELQWFIDF